MPAILLLATMFITLEFPSNILFQNMLHMSPSYSSVPMRLFGSPPFPVLPPMYQIWLYRLTCHFLANHFYFKILSNLDMMVHALILALGKLRQKDCEFKVSLGHIDSLTHTHTQTHTHTSDPHLSHFFSL
jgi:hypothetical protein